MSSSKPPYKNVCSVSGIFLNDIKSELTDEGYNHSNELESQNNPFSQEL